MSDEITDPLLNPPLIVDYAGRLAPFDGNDSGFIVYIAVQAWPTHDPGLTVNRSTNGMPGYAVTHIATGMSIWNEEPLRQRSVEAVVHAVNRASMQVKVNWTRYQLDPESAKEWKRVFLELLPK